MIGFGILFYWIFVNSENFSKKDKLDLIICKRLKYEKKYILQLALILLSFQLDNWNLIIPS